MMSEEITRAGLSDVGCWIDGHWGQYGIARMVELAKGYGYADDEVINIAMRHLDECEHPHTDNEISDDEHQNLSDAADEVEAWLNENVASDGFYFEWYEGEFFLRATFRVLADAEGLTKLKWEGQDYRGGVWHETNTPEGGDTVSMGTLGMQPFGQYDHGEADAYEVPCTIWGDYVGGAYERSNYRSLIRDMPDTFIEVTGGYNSQYLAIAADYSGDDAEDLLRIMTGLREQYPLYDEEDYYALETELANEAWDAWLKMDLMSDLDKLGVDTDKVDEDQLRDRFYTLVIEAGEYPYAETADSVVFPGQTEITAQLAAELPHVEEEL